MYEYLKDVRKNIAINKGNILQSNVQKAEILD